MTMRRSPSGRRTLAVLTALAAIASLSGLVQAPPAHAADETAARLPLADASLDESRPTTNFGADPDLWVDAQTPKRFVMRFDVSVPVGKVIKSAVVSLQCTDSSSSGGSIRLVAAGWTESGVTWAAAPAFGAEEVAKLPKVSSGTRYQADLTVAARDASALPVRELNVGWVSSSTDGADFASKEAAESRRPTLTLVFGDPASDPGPPPPPGPEPLPDPAATNRPPVADASIQQSTDGTNYGSNPALVVDSSPSQRFLMRFDLRVPVGKEIKSAILWLTCINTSNAGGSIRPTTGAWTEAGVTWNNAPAFGGTAVATMGSVNSGTRYQVDLTAAARSAGTQLDVGWVPTSSDGAQFASKEASDAARRPILVVAYGDPGPDPEPQPGQAFDVGLIGDTPYSATESQELLALRDTMNGAGLAYAVHVGDIKSATSACSDSHYTNARNIFDGSAAPFIYTPGDNEWSDCSGQELNRLSFIRQTFFPGVTSQTLGQRRESVTRQSSSYPENARWTKGGILFATLHTVGGGNGSGSERTARTAADIAWLRAAFAQARADGSRGAVIITHANWGDPFNSSEKAAFQDLISVLEEEVGSYGKPVVFVHGDTHHFRIDNPLGAPNFMRIEVHAGADDWVRLRVVDDARVFTASSMDG